MVHESLRHCLEQIPNEPGCYFFKDGAQKDSLILYIGKAKDLRKRVSQYFLANRDAKTAAMVDTARHIEWIVTRSEVEALLLEARLIRTHKPPFNIDLRDNKRYAYIRITDEEYPRLLTSRDPGAARQRDLIGPFTDGSARVQLMVQARRLFRLRVCRQMPKKVCLYYHLGQCSGPCEGKVTREEYLRDVDRARMFMRGQAPELVAELEREMAAASRELRFEEAKRLRDTINAVQYSGARQAVAAERRFDEDVLLARKLETHYLFLVLHVRKGMIAEADEFRVKRERVDDDAPVDDFIKSYYQDHAIPDELLLESPLQDGSIEEYLRSAKSSGRFAVQVPVSGVRRALLDVAVKNITSRIDQTNHLLLQVQDALRLPFLPQRIDAFDNSHIHGTDLVGACVRFTDAKPEKSQYRRFIIKSVEGNDDFASMREAVARRYRREEDLPDLILIDGGKGQLMAAYQAMEELGYSVPMIGLAKREEEIFVPGLPDPLPVDPKSETSRLLQRIRDEVHRFVITFHRARRAQRQVRSALDDVPGIGPQARFRLLQRFGTLDAVRRASEDELAAVLNKRQISALREHFAAS